MGFPAAASRWALRATTSTLIWTPNKTLKKHRPRLAVPVVWQCHLQKRRRSEAAEVSSPGPGAAPVRPSNAASSAGKPLGRGSKPPPSPFKIQPHRELLDAAADSGRVGDVADLVSASHIGGSRGREDGKRGQARRPGLLSLNDDVGPSQRF